MRPRSLSASSGTRTSTCGAPEPATRQQVCTPARERASEQAHAHARVLTRVDGLAIAALVVTGRTLLLCCWTRGHRCRLLRRGMVTTRWHGGVEGDGVFSGGVAAGGVFSGGRCNFTVGCSHDCDWLSDVAAAELCMRMDRLCLFAALTARGCNGRVCVLARSASSVTRGVRAPGAIERPCSMRHACQVCAVRPLPLHERLHIACSAAADESI